MNRFSNWLTIILLLGSGGVYRAALADESGHVAPRMKQFVDAQTISGAVTLVAQHGKVLSLNAVGLADIATNRPMRSDTLFWIASMTKPITATAVMILQDEGKLTVDEPVGKYLPEFIGVKLPNGSQLARPLTIADLLSHTSGVTAPAADSIGRNATLAETVAAIAKQPLQFEPGKEWKYGLGLSVAGRIVEVASGLPFDEFLQNRIFRPLQMHDTTFNPTIEQHERLAIVYRWDRDTKRLAPASSVLNRGFGGERGVPNPSGGLCSTAGDCFRFFQMIASNGELDGQRIVSAMAVKQMTAVRTGELPAGHSPGMGWSLGWGVVREPTGLTAALSPGTYGHGGAFGTLVWIEPQRDAVLILMISRSDLNPVQESNVRGEFAKAALAELK
jgi:CubicO group peptidase (beta-lactamase class C family)